TVDGTLKVALGSTHEVGNILGTTTSVGTAFGIPTGVTAAGNFAEPSNNGSITRDRFSVVPEAQIRVGFDVTQDVNVFVGNHAPVATDVPPPGNATERNTNPTDLPLFGGPGGAANGPPSPLPQLKGSDFWAHGISFGIQLQF